MYCVYAHALGKTVRRCIWRPSVCQEDSSLQNYSDNLWASDYHCLSAQTVVFCNASLGVLGQHCFGYLPLPCFFFLTVLLHSDVGLSLWLALQVTADGTKLNTRARMISLGFRVTFDSPSVLAAQIKVLSTWISQSSTFAWCVDAWRATGSHTEEQGLKAGHI